MSCFEICPCSELPQEKLPRKKEAACFCGHCLLWLRPVSISRQRRSIKLSPVYYKAILSFQALLVAQYGGTLIVITMFNCWLCWFYDSNRPHLLFQRSRSCLAAFHLSCSLSATLFLPKQTWQHQGWKRACYTAQQSQRLALNRSLLAGFAIARVLS